MYLIRETYFLIFNKFFWKYPDKRSLIISLMGILAFLMTAIKHIKRRNPPWMVWSQFRGMVMCAWQVVNGGFKIE